MREQADDKKDAAWKLADAFLHGLYGEPLFESRYDRAMSVMVLVVRFLTMENVTPESFLPWLAGKVAESLVEGERQEDDRRKSCH